jgi:integrase
MAWLEKRNRTYHISFVHGGQHYSRTLKTADPRKAEAAKARLEENLADVERGRLEVPPGAELAAFLLSDGKVLKKVVVQKELTLGALFARYHAKAPDGAKESNTRYTEKIHTAHLLRLLGENLSVRAVTTEALQGYVDARAKEAGRRKKAISHVTIQKEVGSLAAIWNKWALPQGLVKGPAPTRGLIYRKVRSKPPFQTYEQIERQIKRGGLEPAEEVELWDSVFLTLPEVDEFLEFVKGQALRPFIYPMFVFAAHTGARRSELLRSRIDDLDFGAMRVTVREKKKDRSKEMTFRSVPMSPLLHDVMAGWLTKQPGGNFAFCGEAGKALTVQLAAHHFRWTVDSSSKWAKLRGWHVLRHSFISNCAARGVDQRMIDRWVGHTTEEMRRRYLHLFPSDEKKAIDNVFAGG